MDAIYVASRASVPERPALWKALRADGWAITSSWIDESEPNQTADFGELWARITEEIRQSCGVLLYTHKEDWPLRGALIECGIAIGMRLPVSICLNDTPVTGRTFRPVGSWIKHPLVEVCPDVFTARHSIITRYWDIHAPTKPQTVPSAYDHTNSLQ